MAFWSWSKTAASNNSADALINWAEGQAPSSVNDSARAMMAVLAGYRDDIAGRITTGGTSTAYTAASNSSYAATPADGALVAATMHATNGASPTLAVDSGTAFAITVDGTNAVPAATLIAGSPYVFVFNSSASRWVLHGVYGSPTTIPIGGMLDYAGTTAPNSNFALAYNQNISRTTYATLFALVGTTFGAGDGSTTFGLPDTRGRVIAGLDNLGGSAASRITVAGGNFDGTVLGTAGGAQNHALTLAELAAHTHTGTSDASGAHSHSGTSGSSGAHSHSGTTGTESVDHTHTVSGTTSGQSAQHHHSYNTGGNQNNVQVGAATAVQQYPAVVAASTGDASADHTHDWSGITTDTFAAHTHAFTTDTFAAHTHTFTSASSGSGTAHTVLQPTMVLAKIIRIF